MAQDDWLEQRTRIPFAGIIGIVLIVAVVAVFLRSSLDRVLPTGDVAVDGASGGAQAAQAGADVRGSASFAGERDIPLVYKERLQGLLSSNAQTLSFTVDVPAKTMVVMDAGARDEIVLTRSDDGLGLVAQFEHKGMPVSVLIYPSDRTLSWRAQGSFPIDVALTDVVSYEGFFLYSDTQYLFRFYPAGAYAAISAGAQETDVALTDTQSGFAGTWYDSAGAQHPLTVDVASLKATVGELW